MQNACEKYIKGIFIKYLDDGFENVISIAVRGEKGEHGFLVIYFTFFLILFYEHFLILNNSYEHDFDQK